MTILLIAALWASSQTSASFEPARIELGVIRAGTILEPTCVFRNPTAEPLLVEAIRPGCGCLRVTGLPKELPPNSTHTLRLRLNTLTPAPGPHTWRVTVRVCPIGAEARDEVVTLHGTIVREVTIEPTALDLTLPDGEASETVVGLRDTRSKPLRVVAVRSSLTGLTHEQRGNALHLKIPASPMTGMRSEVVQIDTDDPTYPTFEIPLTIRPRSPQRLNITPAEPTIRLPQGAPAASILLQVRNPNEGSLEITDVSASIPNVAIRWSPGLTPSPAIRVTLPRKSVPPEGWFDLTITAGSPSVVQSLRIMVRTE